MEVIWYNIGEFGTKEDKFQHESDIKISTVKNFVY